LGPKLGRQLPILRKLLAEDGERLLADMEKNGHLDFDLPNGIFTLTPDDIQIHMHAKPGWTAAQGSRSVVVLSTNLTPELIAEGLARDLVRMIQDRRKEMRLNFTDRIMVGIVTESEELRTAVTDFGDYIRGETLAIELRLETLEGIASVDTTVAGYSVDLYVKVVQ
jgi:isoleucyl-tRNA synthetase